MTLWTPSGEHPVDRPGPPSPGGAATTDPVAAGPDEARQRLLESPAGPVVGEQALQFYELAALHLSQPEPRLDDARTAIDALAAVVQALGPRLGEAENPLRQALNQLQLAFVEASRGQPAPPSADAG
jgi:hypothetical protein